MASNNRIKVLRIFSGVIIALLAAGLLVAYSCGWYVKRHLPEWALKATDSAYHLSVGDVSVNLLSGRISAKDMDIVPDTARLLALARTGRPQKVAIALHIPRLQADGFTIMRLARKHELSCDAIMIWQPRVLIKPVPLYDTITEQEQQPTAIKGIYATKVLIMQPDIMYRAKDEDNDSFICHLYGGQTTLNELQLIPGKIDSSRVLLSQNCIIDSAAFSFNKKKGLYTVRVPAFYANTAQKKLLVQGFSIHPLVDHEAFYRRIGHRTTICDIYVASASLSGLDWKRLLHDHHEINTDSLQLVSPVISLYFDYRQPSRKGSVVDKDPHNILRGLAEKLYVRHVAVKNGHLAYTELSDESKRAATISFGRINGYAANITNIKRAVQRDPKCIVSLAGVFMHKSDMNAKLELNLADTLGGYKIEGHIKQGDAAEINEVARNLALIQVDSLQLNSMDAYLHGDQTYVDGRLNIRYTDLKAELEKPVPVDNLKRKATESYIANKFLVYHANPMPGKKERSAATNQQRDPEVPFFGTLVKNIKHNGRKIVVKAEPVVDIVTGDTKDIPVLENKKGFFRRLFRKK